MDYCEWHDNSHTQRGWNKNYKLFCFVGYGRISCSGCVKLCRNELDSDNDSQSILHDCSVFHDWIRRNDDHLNGIKFFLAFDHLLIQRTDRDGSYSIGRSNKCILDSSHNFLCKTSLIHFRNSHISSSHLFRKHRDRNGILQRDSLCRKRSCSVCSEYHFISCQLKCLVQFQRVICWRIHKVKSCFLFYCRKRSINVLLFRKQCIHGNRGRCHFLKCISSRIADSHSYRDRLKRKNKLRE